MKMLEIANALERWLNYLQLALFSYVIDDLAIKLLLLFFCLPLQLFVPLVPFCLNFLDICQVFGNCYLSNLGFVVTNQIKGNRTMVGKDMGYGKDDS